MKNTEIEWATHTFNPWIGCTKVSPGCKHCYAAAQDHRWGNDRWGVNAARERTSLANWRKPRQWNNEAAAIGERHRVFCASLADVFDTHASIDAAWRLELWSLIRQTPQLDWLLLTKRPENVVKVLDASACVSARHNGYMGSDDDFVATRLWLNQWAMGRPPANVVLGTTVEDQQRADERIPRLLEVPAVVHFLSCEPLLERVALTGRRALGASQIDWVICGGESGGGARPMAPAWAKAMRDECAELEIPFLFKQWGDFDSSGKRVGKKVAGRQLDGIQHDGYPTPRAA